VQHDDPVGEFLARGEDHRATARVSIVDDMEQHVCGVVPVAEVDQLVDDQKRRVRVMRKDIRQAPLGRRRWLYA
jgi:hypothetical protein